MFETMPRVWGSVTL